MDQRERNLICKLYRNYWAAGRAIDYERLKTERLKSLGFTPELIHELYLAARQPKSVMHQQAIELLINNQFDLARIVHIVEEYHERQRPKTETI